MNNEYSDPIIPTMDGGNGHLTAGKLLAILSDRKYTFLDCERMGIEFTETQPRRVRK